MKKLIPQTVVKTISPNGWILGFNQTMQGRQGYRGAGVQGRKKLIVYQLFPLLLLYSLYFLPLQSPSAPLLLCLPCTRDPLLPNTVRLRHLNVYGSSCAVLQFLALEKKNQWTLTLFSPARERVSSSLRLYEQISYPNPIALLPISSAQEPLLDQPFGQGIDLVAGCRRNNVIFYTILYLCPLSKQPQIGSVPPPYRRLVVFNQWGFKPLLYCLIPSALCLLPSAFLLDVEPYCVIHLPTQLLYAQQRNCHECGISKFLLGDIEYSPSKESKQIDILPKLDSPSTTSSLSHIPPSKKRRNWGEGNGTIHWRTITKNGLDYPQAYYHWKENGKKRTKYIPKQLLGVIQEAEEQKRPVIEILKLLGVVPKDNNEELLVGIENSPSNDEEQLLVPTSKNSPSNHVRHTEIPTSKDSPSKTRRNKGLGTGNIQWKTITLNGKDYPQAWYHYEEWKNGERVVKKSKYIPKRLITRIQELESEKAPVKEILKLLRVKL